MALVQGLQGIREAFTFDDVLLKPGLSDILPSEADIRSHVTRAIPLNIPIIASAMDTVTEARMAIAMAQAGGIGVIHRNFDVDGQAAQVRQVKKYESGMVVNPLTIGPDAMLSDAMALMTDHGFSGIPVVTGASQGRAGQTGRHSHQPRRSLCDRPAPEDLGIDDARKPRDGARRRQPGRGEADAAQAPHRKTAGGRRPTRARALAGSRRAAREQFGRERARGRALAGARRAVQQVRVRGPALGLQRGAQHGGGVGVRFEGGEHGDRC